MVFSKVSRFLTVASFTGTATTEPVVFPVLWSTNCTLTLPRLSGIFASSSALSAFSAAAIFCRLLGGGTTVAIPASEDWIHKCCKASDSQNRLQKFPKNFPSGEVRCRRFTFLLTPSSFRCSTTVLNLPFHLRRPGVVNLSAIDAIFVLHLCGLPVEPQVVGRYLLTWPRVQNQALPKVLVERAANVPHPDHTPASHVPGQRRRLPAMATLKSFVQ